MPGEFEDDERPRVFEPESSEDDRRRTRSKSLRKRAITASAKFSNTLRKQSSRVADCRFATISVHEVRDAGEEDSVNKFRQVLIARDLLPPRHDDYHTMLRFLKARKFDLDKTLNMWTEMLSWRKDNHIDTIMQTLNQMYIVNAGNGFKFLWNTAKTFLDPRTTAKIHVLGCKFQNKLLEVIDSRQLPDFLGGDCSCSNEGGCLRSDKGPWNDPEIMKLVFSEEATHSRKANNFYGRSSFEINFFNSKMEGNEISSPESGSESTATASASSIGNFVSVTAREKCSTSRPISSVIEPTDAAGLVEEYSSNNLNADVQPARQPKKLITQVMSTFIHFVFKFFACIYLLVPGFRRIFMIRHTENQQREASSENHLEDSGTREESKESAVDPLWKRLLNLEVMVTELTNKPSKIPLEKEDMLHESLNRIKSIEYDLQKTKRALLVTASKQVELAESMESIKENNLVGANSCWPRNRKTFLNGS